jgi:hypothetical protein
VRELQVPTRKVDVELHTISGELMVGSLFLIHESWGPAYSALLKLLIDDRAFLPFARCTEAGDIEHIVINKDQILRVRTADETAEDAVAIDDLPDELEVPTSTTNPPPNGAPTKQTPNARVVLVDGSEIEGQLEIDTPWQEARVIDKLNRAADFMPLRTVHGVEIVQRRYVVRAS